MSMDTDSVRPRGVRLTARDLPLLELASEHRVILPGHAAVLLGVSEPTAGGRLRRLAAGGYLVRHRVFAGHPACYQATRKGLEAIGSRLPRPRLDLGGYDHDIGLAWLWLAARSGAFGPLDEALSERTLRSRDGRAQRGNSGHALTGPLGVRLGGTGWHGRERLHYPDLLLITPEGRRIAVELELTTKGRARREQILAGYGSDARIDAVLYLVEHPSAARVLRSSARRLGIGHLVHVQWVRRGEVGASPAQRSTERTRQISSHPTVARAAGGREP